MDQSIRRRGLDYWMGVVLDWNVVQRSALLSFLIFLETLQYCIWAVSVYFWPYAHQFISAKIIAQFMPIGLLLPVISAALYLVCRYYSHRPHQHVCMPLQYAVACFYTLAMSYFGYLIGSMSIAAGVVLMGAPIFGLLMLDRRPVYCALGIGMLGMLGLSWVCLKGFLPYAPLLIGDARGDLAGSGFWFWSMVFFIVPHIMTVIIICDALMTSLRRREADVRYLSERDSLTGLLNRRSINHALDQLVKSWTGEQKSVGLILMDLDHFKNINDTHGHLAGDQVLVSAAQVFRQVLRKHDLIGRFGGEEFIIVISETTADEVEQVAERIRQQLMNLQVQDEQGRMVNVRGSFGAVCQPLHPQLNFNELVSKADRALYQAKTNGRNQVVMA